jgi:hypothetical protein
MIETSNDTAKLDEALAKAQGEIEAASKDRNNPAFKSKYADITSIWEAARPALAKHGISVTQWPVHADDTRLHIVTRVAFKGEWIRAHFSIPVTKNDAQGYGSATTYAKRYALAAALGVVADDDDDGNAASARPQYEPKKAAAPMPPTDVESIGDTFVRRFNEAATSEEFEEEVSKARAAWHRLGVAGKAKVQNSIAARRAFWQQSPASEAAE